MNPQPLLQHGVAATTIVLNLGSAYDIYEFL
jgi:hypothetical protein